MKRLLSVFASLLCAAAAACSGQAPTAASPSAAVPTASTEGLAANTGPHAAPMPLTTYIESDVTNPVFDNDGNAAYPDNVGGVTTALVANGYNSIRYGDWQFDTYSSTSRHVKHTFTLADAVLPGSPSFTAPAAPPFTGTQTLTSHIEVVCTLANHNMLTMTAGSSFLCGLVNRFNYQGVDYFLNPNQGTNAPETSNVLVVCNSVNSGGCNNWDIASTAGLGIGQGYIGRLLLPIPKHSSTHADGGDFFMRFHVHLTRP